jgi:hypothetical protein
MDENAPWEFVPPVCDQAFTELASAKIERSMNADRTHRLAFMVSPSDGLGGG